MMIQFIVNSLLLFCITSTLYAAVPADLLFHHKPIDPRCFFYMEGAVNKINLSACEPKKNSGFIQHDNTKLTQKGYIGYHWQEAASQGYSYYQVFNAGHHLYWLYTINGTGGSGDFTSIQLVKRKHATQLDSQTIVGGDRCNGGIQNVFMRNNRLFFSVNLTPYDLLTMTNVPETSIKAYDDLAACAVCCVAKAFYQVYPHQSPQLDYVRLNPAKHKDEMPQQGIYQACFNQVAITHIRSGNSPFKQDELTQFNQKLMQQCIKHAPH